MSKVKRRLDPQFLETIFLEQVWARDFGFKKAIDESIKYVN
jgi:hypothetical protein